MPDTPFTGAINELDSVILTRAIKGPVEDATQVYLPIGARGVVMHVYGDGLAYEVEFYSSRIAVLTVLACGLKKWSP